MLTAVCQSPSCSLWVEKEEGKVTKQKFVSRVPSLAQHALAALYLHGTIALHNLRRLHLSTFFLSEFFSGLKADGIIHRDRERKREERDGTSAEGHAAGGPKTIIPLRRADAVAPAAEDVALFLGEPLRSENERRHGHRR